MENEEMEDPYSPRAIIKRLQEIAKKSNSLKPLDEANLLKPMNESDLLKILNKESTQYFNSLPNDIKISKLNIINKEISDITPNSISKNLIQDFAQIVKFRARSIPEQSAVSQIEGNFASKEFPRIWLRTFISKLLDFPTEFISRDELLNLYYESITDKFNDIIEEQIAEVINNNLNTTDDQLRRISAGAYLLCWMQDGTAQQGKLDNIDWDKRIMNLHNTTYNTNEEVDINKIDRIDNSRTKSGAQGAVQTGDLKSTGQGSWDRTGEVVRRADGSYGTQSNKIG